MTLFLGLIAATLLVAIIATFVVSNRQGETAGFTLPHELEAASRAAKVASAAATSPRASIAPQPVGHVPLDNMLAQKQADLPTTLASFYPGNLGVGTTLTYRGVDSEIFGVLSFDFEGVLWQDYLAEHAAGQWWRFGVEPDRGMKLAAFETRELGVVPGPDTLSYEGQSYRLTESGQANYRSAGRTGQFETGRYWYFDYENDARVILSFERFDSGPWITSIGHHVNPETIKVCNTVPTDQSAS